MRLAIVERNKCSPKKCQEYCKKMCPVNRGGENCIVIDKTASIDESLCNGCGICQKCPFEAISIINLPEKLKEDPIHRYGQNQFELFHLPIPKKGKIVGLLGRNGIGKSTALEILSNNLKPNLSNYNEPPSEEKIIEKYHHVILGDYLKKLYSKGITISYKPQRIELLPKVFSGKVKDLIKKIDKNKIGDKLFKELDMENLKDRDINNLSGGELQKLAIIATCVKKADFYFFDEPASFLDVTNRIKVANIIKQLDGAVMVVEHDLATLDYISDEIQIIYGKQACYGIISQSKGVRRGINEYLDGYLPDDNVRFRDYEIKFSKNIVNKFKGKNILLEFPELEKSFKDFSLKVNAGSVNKKEVLTIMGANGLGKTTFLKLLAGVEKPDKGEIKKLKIAYKVQYPEVAKGTVRQWLMKIAKKDFNSGWYKQNILEKLGLNKVLDQELKNLSGGELQKVHIALTLSQDAEIYAFDEPSAFIDVEDRLTVAEVIKEFVFKKEACGIVVDHDVQFVDYLGDKMLVFEGVSGKEGKVYGPCDKVEGMNRVLKMLNITYRHDPSTYRPRINKPGSTLDREQRKKGNYYYN